MVATAAVTCTAGQYTPLNSAGQTNVTFKAGFFGGLMVIATSSPANDANAYPLESREKIALGSLGSTDIVYYKPGQAVDETVKVIRG